MFIHFLFQFIPINTLLNVAHVFQDLIYRFDLLVILLNAFKKWICIYSSKNQLEIKGKYIVKYRNQLSNSEFTCDDFLDVYLLVDFGYGLRHHRELSFLDGAEFLSLLMPGVLQTLDVHLLVVLDHLAPVAHLPHCCSDLHFLLLFTHTT